jgi:hypothetical protein
MWWCSRGEQVGWLTTTESRPIVYLQAKETVREILKLLRSCGSRTKAFQTDIGPPIGAAFQLLFQFESPDLATDLGVAPRNRNRAYASERYLGLTILEQAFSGPLVV